MILDVLTIIKGWVSKLTRIGKSAVGREHGMVRIRLRRQGSKGQPTYRIVVIDQRKARNGKYLENIGHYNPRTRPATEVIKEDRALYWLSVGAQPSDAARRILYHTGTWERFQRLKAGESMDELVKEAEEDRKELPSPKTNYPAPADGESKIKSREAAPSGPGESTDGKIDPSRQAPQPDNDTERIADVPGAPAELLEPATNEEGRNRLKDKSPKANDEVSDLNDPISIYDAFNRPGKTKLNDPDPLPNPLMKPELRLERKREEIQAFIGRGSGRNERKCKMSLKRERRDPATKNFLKEEYKGKCQIQSCGFTFPRWDGEPHFVAVYILGYEEIDDAANALCLCPNHFAMFKHGHKEAPDIIEEIRSYEGSSHHHVNLQLIDQDTTISFTARHILDFIALLENIENR